MSTWLYLTPEGLNDLDGICPVRYWSDDGSERSCPLSEAGNALSGVGVQLILPMELCSWLRSEPWPGRRTPRAQVLAYAVEEQLSEDLDQLHLAIGKPDRERRFPLLIISKPTLLGILDAFQRAGIQVIDVWVDADRLPTDRPYGVWWSGRWMLGGSIEGRLALSEQALDVMRHRLPIDIRWRDERSDDCPGLSALLSASNRDSINLMQGEFRPTRQGWLWGPLLLAMMGVFLLSWGFSLARAQHLESLAGQLYEQSLQRFHSLYPDQTRVVDLSAQLKALQGNAAEERGPMSALLQVAEQVVGGSGVQVQRAEFSATEGWTLSLNAGSFDALERLQERGVQSGLPVRLEGASKSRDGVKALLTLQGGAK